MRPNAITLARRDPAMAALLGAIPGDDFGGEADFGTEFGDFFAGEPGFFSGDGDSDMGAEFGDEFGADAPQPSQAQVMQLWQQHRAARAAKARREHLLEPNRHSPVKIERYVFPLSQAITLGTPVALVLADQPDTAIRPQRMTTNAPVPMFATITEIKLANVSINIGGGAIDAFNYNANAWGIQMDMPTLSPSNRARVLGAYSGVVPAGFPTSPPLETTFTVAFIGPATIVA